jgi:hypothetical protein
MCARSQDDKEAATTPQTMPPILHPDDDYPAE